MRTAKGIPTFACAYNKYAQQLKDLDSTPRFSEEAIGSPSSADDSFVVFGQNQEGFNRAPPATPFVNTGRDRSGHQGDASNDSANPGNVGSPSPAPITPRQQSGHQGDASNDSANPGNVGSPSPAPITPRQQSGDEGSDDLWSDLSPRRLTGMSPLGTSPNSQILYISKTPTIEGQQENLNVSLLIGFTEFNKVKYGSENRQRFPISILNKAVELKTFTVVLLHYNDAFLSEDGNQFPPYVVYTVKSNGGMRRNRQWSELKVAWVMYAPRAGNMSDLPYKDPRSNPYKSYLLFVEGPKQELGFLKIPSATISGGPTQLSDVKRYPQSGSFSFSASPRNLPVPDSLVVDYPQDFDNEDKRRALFLQERPFYLFAGVKSGEDEPKWAVIKVKLNPNYLQDVAAGQRSPFDDFYNHTGFDADSSTGYLLDQIVQLKDLPNIFKYEIDSLENIRIHRLGRFDQQWFYLYSKSIGQVIDIKEAQRGTEGASSASPLLSLEGVLDSPEQCKVQTRFSYQDMHVHNIHILSPVQTAQRLVAIFDT